MKRESWRGNLGGIVERNRGGGIMEGQPWRMHHGGVSMEETARRRQEPQGDTQEAPEGTQEAPRRQPEAPRRQPGGKICICVKRAIMTAYLQSFYQKFLLFTFTRGFLRVGVIMYAFLQGKMTLHRVGGSRGSCKAVIQDRENPISKASLGNISKPPINRPSGRYVPGGGNHQATCYIRAIYK